MSSTYKITVDQKHMQLVVRTIIISKNKKLKSIQWLNNLVQVEYEIVYGNREEEERRNR